MIHRTLQAERLLRLSGLRRRCRRADGFTLLEILVILAVLGILAGITLSIFLSYRPKTMLTGTAHEIKAMIQKARIAAVRQNQTVIAEIETQLGGEVTTHNPTGIQNEWLVLKTIDAYSNEEEIDSYQFFRGFPPIYLWGPDEVSIHGASSNTFRNETLAYQFDGSVESTGALRLSYAKDGVRNILEVAVPTLSGSPVIRKYLDTDDRPSSAASQEFFQQTVASSTRRRALWVWY